MHIQRLIVLPIFTVILPLEAFSELCLITKDLEGL